MRRRWPTLLKRHPSAALLAVQLLSLPLYVVLDGTTGRLVFSAITLLVVILALRVITRSPAHSAVGWLLALPAMALTLAGIVLHLGELLPWMALLEALLYLYAAAGLIAYMMSDHQVTRDELFAAGATFTLLAWGFGYLYAACQYWVPGSFSGMLEPDRARTWMELLFLSFTTLSGVGVGDIVPLTPAARALVMIEQFAGVGYIAVVVSRLIGLTVVRARGR
ncbi:MAG: potassium channel family protein [Pseudoxanthomonas suwonensis]|nr:potassium channel family protein [Pseudoxanthomonas suwonensis]